MDALTSILDLARWAPSGDNQQTWRFKVTDSRNFSVLAWDTRDHCVYDLQGRASQIALGGLLEAIRIAATHCGIRAVVTPIDTGRVNTYQYDIQLCPDPELAKDPLADWIPKRTVQRRPMSTRPLNQAQKVALETAIGGGHRLLWFESAADRRKVARLLFRSAKLRLTTPEAYETHSTVIDWRARFSATKVPDQAIGLDPLSTRLTEWALASWARVQFANRYLGGTLFPRVQLDLLPALACAAHFMIIAAHPPISTEDHLLAGAAWLRMWLTCASLGLYLQPEMTPLIFCGYARSGLAFTSESTGLREAAALAEAFESLTGGANAARAVVMGRLGAGKAPNSRSLRRPLAELMLAGDELPAEWGRF